MTSTSLPPASSPVLHKVRIKPSKGWVSLKLNELWEYRELMFFLVWRDIAVRYKQTVLGAAWAIIQPVSTMIIFSIIFGRLAKLQSDGLPYPLFSYAALVPWSFFAGGLQGASNSLIGNAQLLSKVYFPRLIIPIAEVMAEGLDFILAFLVLIILMIIYQRTPTINIIFLPFFMLLALVTALGVGLWFSALNVQFRDVRYVLPFMLQFWLYATPIAYSSKLIEDPVLRTLYGINPMVGVVEGFRWALLGLGTPPGPMIWVSAVAAVLILISGAFYFKRMERSFADVV